MSSRRRLARERLEIYLVHLILMYRRLTLIVARGIGIPAVVGCGNATMLLKTGDTVRVDGGRGTVEILSH